MTRLFASRMDLSRFIVTTTQQVIWRLGAVEVTLNVSEDEAFAYLLRFWVHGAPVSVRGRAGSAGSLGLFDTGALIDVRSWGEGGRSIVVGGHEVSGRDLDRFVSGLRAARPGEWEQIRRRVVDVSSEAAVETCAGRDQKIVAVGRREERYRWAVGFWSPRPGEAAYCHVILTPEDQLGHRPADGILSLKRRALTITSQGIGTDPTGTFVLGVAPPGTAHVRVEAASGSIDALLTDGGPEPRHRYFGLFAEDGSGTPTIIAVDGSGAELDRIPR